jgi:hypothetical protein
LHSHFTCHALLLLQVNRRQAHAEAVTAEYAALQQEHTTLENELLEAKSQVHLLQAEVRRPCACRGKAHSHFL